MKQTCDFAEMAPPAAPRRRRAVHWKAMTAAFALLVGCASASNGTGGSKTAGANTWGYVLKVNGKDAVRVDKVLARFEGDSKQTTMITVARGEATPAIVKLGQKESLWPSTISADNKGGYIPVGAPAPTPGPPVVSSVRQEPKPVTVATATTGTGRPNGRVFARTSPARATTKLVDKDDKKV